MPLVDDVVVVESSSSGSDYSDTQERLNRKRQHAKKLGRPVTDTEEEDANVDNEFANQVDSDPGLPNSLRTTEASSSKGKGKQINPGPLKSGPLSAEDKKHISAFSTTVEDMAQCLATRLRISKQNVLINAGFGIRESRGENPANLHAQWYAETHTKPDGSMCFCASSLPF